MRSAALLPCPAEVEAIGATGEGVDVPCSIGTVRWRRFGEGAPLLLLHGGHGSWLHWVRNIPALARHRTLWVPDLPGFGASSDVPDDGSVQGPLDRLVDALLDTMPESSVAEPPDVVAFSFGALVTAHLHRRGLPMRSIALLGPASHGGERGPSVEMPPWRHTVTASDREDALRRNLLAFMLHRPEAADATAVYAQEQSSQLCRLRVIRSVSRASRIGPMFASFDGPMLFAWGEHDVTGIAAAAGPMLVGGRSNREWHAVPGAAHWVQFDRSDAVNALLLGWLQRQDSAVRPVQEPV
jgi:pimeloyl-ACP methyl ester carboxylesterase